MKREPPTLAGRNAAALLLPLCLLAIPSAARAHAYLKHAEPKVGSTVPACPSQVRIWFDGQVDPASSSIEVRAPGGTKVNDGQAHVDPSDPKLLEVAVLHLATGTYRVAWSVVDRDGHRTSGDYTFTVR